MLPKKRKAVKGTGFRCVYPWFWLWRLANLRISTYGLWFMVTLTIKKICITKETVEQWTVLYVPNISLELQMYCHVRNAAPCTVYTVQYSTVYVAMPRVKYCTWFPYDNVQAKCYFKHISMKPQALHVMSSISAWQHVTWSKPACVVKHISIQC